VTPSVGGGGCKSSAPDDQGEGLVDVEDIGKVMHNAKSNTDDVRLLR